MIVIKWIYLVSVIMACLYFWVGEILINYHISRLSEKDYEELLKDEDFRIFSHYMTQSPMLYKMLAVFIPVINTLILLLFMLVLANQAVWLWTRLGRRIIRRWSRSMRGFRVKEFLVRRLWPGLADDYYHLLDKGPLKAVSDEIVNGYIDTQRREIIQSEANQERNMTKKQAKEAMEIGLKVAHRDFISDTYVYMHGAHFYSSLNGLSDWDVFFKNNRPGLFGNGWYVYEESQQTENKA